MSGRGNLIVQTVVASSAPPVLAELVQAWARDIDTGEPRHILEDEGWIDLPRRRMSARATGLSGAVHEAWVELPPERVRITEIDFRDRAVAMLTLADGRQLRVELTGTLDAGTDLALDADGHPLPTILLSVDDPSLAGMAPDALRRRLRLLPDGLCWRSHWRDGDLADQAEAAVRGKALFYFDEVPDGLDLPADLDPALKRQTLLHHEVMRLLSEAQMLRVPGWQVYVEAVLPDRRVVRREAATDPDWLNLGAVCLEQRFGNIVPDITCEADAVEGGPPIRPLFIEVTVSNVIVDERLERIRAAGKHTLEIDLSLAGGRVDRETLGRLVVEELAVKRWLHHPDLALCSAALAAELAEEEAAARAAADRQTQLRALPLADLANRYLDAALRFADAELAGEPTGRMPFQGVAEASCARAALAEVVSALGARGYKEAGDSRFIGMHGILNGVLSIHFARPIGYDVETLVGVLDAIEQAQGAQLADTSLYLIAVRAYRPPLSQEQQDRFEEWVGRVRDSLKRGESTYRRNPRFDRLLSMLFPEMAAMLAKPGGKRRLDDEGPGHGDGAGAKPAGLENLHTRSHGGWLQGQDLETWLRAHPESVEWVRTWLPDVS